MMQGTIAWMSGKPGKPTVPANVAERFRVSLEHLVKEISGGNIAAFQRYAAKNGHIFSRTAWSNQLDGTSQPSQKMQLAIAHMLRVPQQDIYDGKWSPGMPKPEGEEPWPWRQVIEMAAQIDGYTLDDVDQFFQQYPERGNLSVRDAMTLISVVTGKNPTHSE